MNTRAPEAQILTLDKNVVEQLKIKGEVTRLQQVLEEGIYASTKTALLSHPLTRSDVDRGACGDCCCVLRHKKVHKIKLN